MDRSSRVETGLFCCMCCSGLVLLLICIGLFASVGIAELVMVGKHGSEIVCDSPIMSLQAWLIVDGIVNIANGIIIGLLYFGEESAEQFAQTAHRTNKPFIIFGLIWTIIGSIVFWRDCPQVTPHSIYNLMYAVLILSYISIYLHYDAETGYKKKQSTKTSNNLMLQINIPV